LTANDPKSGFSITVPLEIFNGEIGGCPCCELEQEKNGKLDAIEARRQTTLQRLSGKGGVTLKSSSIE
jgi:hypothetical protein